MLVICPHEKRLIAALSLQHISFNVEEIRVQGETVGDATNIDRSFVAERKNVFTVMTDKAGGKHVVSDLYNSIKSGRLFTQLAKMDEFFPDVPKFLVLEGDLGKFYRYHASKRGWMESSILTAAMRFGARIIPTIDVAQTARVLHRIDQRTVEPQERYVATTSIFKHVDPRIAALCSMVRGLGEKKAIALVDKFGSLERIFNATVDELREARGIGKKLAEKIIANYKATSRPEA